MGLVPLSTDFYLYVLVSMIFSNALRISYRLKLFIITVIRLHCVLTNFTFVYLAHCHIVILTVRL